MKLLTSALLAQIFLISAWSVLSLPSLSAAQASPVLQESAEASGPAGESKTVASGQRAAAAKGESAEVLRGFKTYYIKSETIYLHRETLLKELQQRGEFSAWDLTAAGDPRSADVIISITLPFLTWEWNYKMIHQPTGTVIGTGKVSAAVEKTAAPQLAALIVKGIQEARPLPASFQSAQSAPQTPSNRGPEAEKSWKVRFAGPEHVFRQGAPVTVTVGREWITVRDSKKSLLSIPTAKARTADSRTEIRKATKGWEDFWDRNCCGDSAGAVLLIAPIFLAGYGILAPIKTTDHFVSLYWLENGSMRGVEFRVSAGDTESLLAELKKVTGRTADDLVKASTEKQKLIAEQYAASPIVEIKSQVKLGWTILWPGHYRLIVVPRTGSGETDLAEVYFFEANKPTPDFLSGDAIVQMERQKAPLDGSAPPTISYREQNGVVMFDQIATDKFILRFTAIPLGGAK